MKKYIILLFSVNFLVFSSNIDEATRLLEREQRRIEQERIRNENELKIKELENSKLGTEIETESTVAVNVDEPKFLVENINIDDSDNLFNQNEEFSFFNKYRYSYMGTSSINKLIEEMTNKLISKGYITSTVALDENSDLSKGELKLKVISGKIEDIQINSGNSLDRLKEFFMFKKNRGNILNIRDIDEATENFNSLRANNMEIEIEEGKKENQSLIKVKNIMKDKYQVSFIGNNYGENNQNGMWRYGVGVSIDSPLGIGDSFTFSYLTVNKKKADRSWKKTMDELKPGEIMPIGPVGYNPTTETLPYKRRLDMFNLGYTLRFRDYRLRLNSSKSIGESSFYSYNTVYDMKSESHTLSANLEKTVYRSQKSKLNIGIGIKRRHNETYFEKSELSNRKLTIGNIYVSGQTNFLKGILGATLGYEKGLRIFGAERDINKLTTTPKAEGEKITLDVNYYKPIANNFVYRLNINGTYSKDVLYGSERQTIGGVGSVGGYNRTETLQGDRAVEIGNELSYNIPIFNRKANVSPYISYSYGATEINKDTSKYRIGYMTGLTTGVRFSSKLLDFDLGYAKALKHSDYLKPKRDEVYFGGSVKVSF